MSKKKAVTNSVATNKDTSVRVHQREKIAFPLTIRERDDLTEKQKVILEAALHKDTRCIMIDGIWGTGKSMLATLAALKLLDSGRAKSILYVRSPGLPPSDLISLHLMNTELPAIIES